MINSEASRLRRELDTVKARLEQLETNGREEPVVVETTGGSASRYGDLPEPTMYDLQDWVVNWFERTLERRTSNTRRWCPVWYDHPEVVSRLWVLYHSYLQVIRHGDAVAQSEWFVEHLDKHLEVLLSADGPFAGCSPQRHSPHRGLQVNRAPDGIWGPPPAALAGSPTKAPVEVNQ